MNLKVFTVLNGFLQYFLRLFTALYSRKAVNCCTDYAFMMSFTGFYQNRKRVILLASVEDGGTT